MHLANYHKSGELSIPFWDESGAEIDAYIWSEIVDLEGGFWYVDFSHPR
jgi:hypothetical protein